MDWNGILMKPIPKDIKSSAEGLNILWSDGHKSHYPGRDLRMSCRCAGCVDEWTHASLLKPELIPKDIKPKAINIVGSYALQIDWSDGHSTGIFTYDYLREICACEECKAHRSFTV